MSCVERAMRVMRERHVVLFRDMVVVHMRNRARALRAPHAINVVENGGRTECPENERERI